MESPKGRTIAEKILGAHAGRELEAGEFAIVSVDQLLGTDGSAPMAIDLFASMGFEAVFDASRIAFSCDHYAPASSARIAALHEKMRSFAEACGITLFRVGEGIGHQRMIEDGRVRPGMIVAGADSHCVTYGALNAFGIGIGASDLAAAMATGKLWLKVPQTLRIVLRGRLTPPAQAKDVILELLRRLRADGADYLALEFSGDGAAALNVEERIVIANMATEAGAKAALVCGRCGDAGLPAQPRHPRLRAGHAGRASALCRHAHDRPCRDHAAACLAASCRQRRSARRSGRGGRSTWSSSARARAGAPRTSARRSRSSARPEALRRGVELVITPASRAELELLIKDGSLAELTALGAVLTTPGCGACCGTSGAIPRDGATVISTGNRNFKGRMGAPKAEIFLASPAACGAAAATGRITEPKVIAT